MQIADSQVVRGGFFLTFTDLHKEQLVRSLDNREVSLDKVREWVFSTETYLQTLDQEDHQFVVLSNGLQKLQKVILDYKIAEYQKRRKSSV